mmetsp:Transcript_7201/g.26966  ORF Transcript_7201/g.26966 Transcript_7201/m.26966 type:complete len:204 (+) Transcript_7201:977-1588(+)
MMVHKMRIIRVLIAMFRWCQQHTPVWPRIQWMHLLLMPLELLVKELYMEVLRIIITTVTRLLMHHMHTNIIRISTLTMERHLHNNICSCQIVIRCARDPTMTPSTRNIKTTCTSNNTNTTLTHLTHHICTPQCHLLTIPHNTIHLNHGNVPNLYQPLTSVRRRTSETTQALRTIHIRLPLAMAHHTHNSMLAMERHLTCLLIT